MLDLSPPSNKHGEDEYIFRNPKLYKPFFATSHPGGVDP